MRISKAELQRVEKAYDVTKDLLSSGISAVDVMHGRRCGPYIVSIRKLDEREMLEVVEILRGYIDARRGAR